jgi:NAD(P)-dependent dehydrogenase (short-subunit alcohol dehydrogenase family)
MDGNLMGDRLDGKIAVITAAGSGIGRAAALRFAAEGASVAALDLNADAAKQTAELVTAAGGRASAYVSDVADEASVEATFDAVAAEFGRIDVLYNNAGIFSRGSVADAQLDDWNRCFAVNVTGTFLCARAMLRHIAPSHILSSEGKYASIVNTGSVAGLVAVAGVAAYNAAKGAVVQLTRSMAADLAPRRVRVNAICPGTVYTPLMEPLITARGEGSFELGLERTLVKYPIGRLGEVDDIANLALFLASDESAFMTGSIVTADGGMTAI